MAESKRGLGRGLAALLPGADEEGIQEVAIAAISPAPHQPRRSFDDASLAELAASIREHGVLQPILVTAQEGSPLGEARFTLVAGERRWRAAALAGLTTIPAIVRELGERESLEVALVENLQREDLNPVEEARAYQELQEMFGLTQDRLAERVGKSRSAVANSLRLLRLPEEVILLLEENRLSEGHGRALLGLPDSADVAQVAMQVIENGLSVRETEALVRAAQAHAAADTEEIAEPGLKRVPPADEPMNQALAEALRRRLGTKVDLVRGRRGGRIVIHFYSDEELDSIFQAIGAEL
ncbi:MAG: ParB/RepB/Spo0J family partition protein [Anaerolineae bacterium]|nr:ParB/RepB/Spo0J family partition protein [Anaerolineae bacterium]